MKNTIVAVTVIGLAAAALAATLGAQSKGLNDDVPTWTVEEVDFSHSVTAEGNLAAVKSTTISAPITARGRQVVAWVADDGLLVREGDVLVRFDRTELERQLEDGKGLKETANNKITKETAESGAELRNLDRDVESAVLQLDAAERFQPVDQEVFSRQEIIEGRVDATLARSRSEYASVKRTRREAEAGKESDILAIEKRRADTAIQRAEEGLTATEVVAPHDGILQLSRRNGKILRAGDTVWRGMELGKIPDLSSMEAEVHVLEADAGGLAEGIAAKLVVEAHPELEFDATIKRVDKLAKPRVRGVPVQYFGVTLALGKTDPSVMKPGQRVRARLDLEQREQAIVIPRQAVFEEENGDKFAWVRRAGSFEKTALTLGPTTPGRIVVEDGLVAGEVVALTEPDTSGLQS